MNRSLPGTESLPGKVGRSNANAANSEFDEDDILASLLAPKTIHHEPSVRNDLEEDTRRNLRAVISARARALEAAAYGAAAYVAASSATCRLREFSESSDNDEGGGMYTHDVVLGDFCFIPC